MRRLGLLALFLAADPGVALAQVNCTNNPGLCGLAVRSTIVQTDLDVAIDIVLIGDGFLDVASWTVVADDAVARILSSPAGYTTRVPGLINVHIVDVLSTTTQVDNANLTDTALGMNVSGPFINADASRVNLAALNAPDVDVVVTIANSGSGRANANYNTQLASGGVVRMSRDLSPTNHELGHALFHLADEYTEAGLCNGAPSELALMLEANVTTDPTCFKFAGVTGAGCVQGGKYCTTGVYRSASGCMMRSNGGPPCPACDHEIDDVLRERRAGRDLANPWIVAQVPATASGMIDLFGRVHDDFFSGAVVTFEIDGTFVGRAGPFGQLRFDSTTLTDGAHSLVALAADLAGHTAASAPVTFTVDNALDAVAPVITIGQPTAGALVSGLVGISVNAAPNTRDIASIVVSIDGQPTAIAIDSPNLFTQWQAPPSGSHRIDAVAIDRSGNVGVATAVTVTATTPRPPSRPAEVVIEAPRDGTAIGPYFSLRWRGGGDEGIGGSQGGGGGSATFDLFLDGARSGPLGESPAVIDASGWALGPHQLRVEMTTTTTVVISAPVFVVRTAPTAPIVLIREPTSGAWLRGTVPVVIVAADDAPLASASLTFEGVLIGSTTTVPGTIAWDTTQLMRGCGQLLAEVVSTDGGRARSPSLYVCVDNEPPIVAITRPRAGERVPLGALAVLAQVSESGPSIELRVDGVIRFTGGFFNPPSAALLADLAAGAHVLEVVATDQAGNVGTSAPVTIEVVAACTAQSCDDGDTCTSDRCAPSGACLHLRTAGCCAVAADCDDGDACSSDSCSSGMCQNAAIPGCCNQGFDCADQDACTQDLCVAGACAHPSAGCCAMASDCDDGIACTTDSCLGAPGICAHDWVPGCCSVAADCDDGDACTANTCTNGACTSAPIASCCRDASTCGDGDRCTADVCTANVCENIAIDGCCTDSADCATLNPCAMTSCGMRGQCESTAVVGCCNFDFECGDGVACTDDTCATNTCRSVVSPICCSAPADCDDGDACTAEACGPSQRCSHSAIAGCCRIDGDCDDGNSCTREICGAGNVCQVVSSTGCPDGGVIEADAAVVVGDDAAPRIDEDAAPGIDADPRADAAPALADASGAPAADAAVVSSPDAAANVEITGSCGCATADEGAPPGMFVLLAGVVILARRRRLR